MSIQSGRYIITNVQHRNLAFLPDDNHDTPLEADHRQDIASEEWKVTDLGNGCYSILNFGYQTFASARYQAEEKEHVISNKNRSRWLIKRSAADEQYTILTLNSKLSWWLEDNWQATPITLQAPHPSDARCLWTFKRIHLEDKDDLGQTELTALRYSTAEANLKADAAEAKLKAVEEEAKSKVVAVEAKLKAFKQSAAEAGLKAETTAIKLKTVEESAREAIRAAEERAEQAIRTAEERELQARKLAEEEVARRNAAEERAQRESELAREETARRRAVKINAELATILTQREVSKGKAEIGKMLQTTSFAHNPLAELEGVDTSTELTAIVDGAFTNIKMVEPWRGATTENPQLQRVIQIIQGYSIVYLKEIDISIKTAQDCYGFSCHAIELCDYLMDPDTDPADFRGYISDIHSTAKQAHEDCVMTSDMFRKVQNVLVMIVKTIPKEALVDTEQKGIFERVLSQIFDWRDVDLDVAIKELNLTALDMSKLVNNVDKFADWWSGMETTLGKAQRNSIGPKPRGSNLRVQGIKKAWTDIRNGCKQYEVQIIQLQAYTSPQRLVTALPYSWL